MPLKPFKLERYFARHEFSTQYLLSASDIEPLTMSELLAMASDAHRQQWQSLRLGYTESQGHPDLLHAISRLYQDIPPQKILTLVPEEGIFIAMRALLDADSHVIVMSPAYQSLYEIAESSGVAVSHWRPNTQWQFDPDMLRDLIRPNTQMIVINTPHNPTGAHFSPDQLQTIVAIAREHKMWLFADEMYRLSEHAPAYRLPAACDLYDKAISLSGLSKSFALPGLRVGWLATRNQDALNRFVRFKDYTTICGSAPSEILAIIALHARDVILARNLQIIQENLAVIDDFFSTHHTLFSWQKPVAGTIALVEWRGQSTVDDLADYLVQKHGIMILPASVYDYAGNYFRLGFGRRTLPAALAQWDTVIRQGM